MKVVLSNIFVAIGFAPQDFSRLIRKVDELTPSLGTQVVMQIGHTQHEPKHAEWFSFAPSLSDHIQNADLVISHGGMTIIEAVQAGKPVIVVPRRARYNEHYSDHQVEIAEAFAQHPAVKVVYDVDELEEAIGRVCQNAKAVEFDDASRMRLVNKLREFVQANSK